MSGAVPAARPWLIALDVCPSTNSWALDHGEALAHGACVWTARQTAGRGRGQNVWIAPAGVLTASWVLRIDVATGPLMALAAGLAVAHAIEDACPRLAQAVQVKWPNDCLIGGRKVAGILCERIADGPVVVGVGLNIDPQWGDDPAGHASAHAKGRIPPTSLAEHHDAPSVDVLLSGIRRYLIEAAGLIRDQGLAGLLPQLRTRDALRGRAIEIDTGDRLTVGRAAGIDDQGRLLIESADGRIALAGGTVVRWD